MIQRNITDRLLLFPNHAHIYYHRNAPLPIANNDHHTHLSAYEKHFLDPVTRAYVM